MNPESEKAMTQKRTRKPKPTPKAEAGATAPQAMPKAGGSYIRKQDGGLDRVAHTEQPAPRSKTAKED